MFSVWSTFSVWGTEVHYEVLQYEVLLSLKLFHSKYTVISSVWQLKQNLKVGNTVWWLWGFYEVVY